MLQELTGYFNSIKKTQAAMKFALCEIQKNLQGTNSEEKETGTQTDGLEQKEETFNQNRMKKQEFKNMRRGLGTSGTTLNLSLIHISEPTRQPSSSRMPSSA